MIVAAEAEGCVVIKVPGEKKFKINSAHSDKKILLNPSPLGVQLLDGVESVLAKLDIPCGSFATLEFVSWNISAEAFDIAETVSGHHDIGTFSFNDLKKKPNQ